MPAKQRSQKGGARTAYLLAYNLAQLAAWSLCVWRLADGRLDEAAALMWAAQVAAAVLETGHAVGGLTRSALGPLLIQQTGRLLVLALASGEAMRLGPEGAAPDAHPSSLPGSAAVRLGLYTSYALAEVVRSSFYAANLAPGGAPGWLTWLRYSAFLALYPAGLMAEALTLLRCNEGSGTLAAAGGEGAAFYAALQWAIFAGLLAFPALGYVLFTNMLRLRAKNLGGAGAGTRRRHKRA